MPSTDLLSALIPQFFPAAWLEGAPGLVFTDFPSCIRVGYVVKGGDSYSSYLMRDAFDSLGVSLDALHKLALDNLRSLPCAGLTVGGTPGGPEAFLKGVDDNFVAVRILLPSVQDALAKHIGDNYYAAIPCRDWFICWSKDQSAEWQTRNIASARDTYIKDDYSLTPDILQRSSAGFSVHLSQRVESNSG